MPRPKPRGGRAPSRRWPLELNRETLWALCLGAASAATRRLPPAVRYASAAGLGRAVSRLFPAKRRAVEENLAVIEAWSGRRHDPERVFQSFGRTLSDFLSNSPVEVRVEGREKAEEARRRGRGTVFMTSHLGNWELGGRVLAEWGWPVTAVYRAYSSPAMQRFIQRRRPAGMSYLAVGQGAARGVAQVLERGGTVAMLADRPYGEDGVETRLCGRPARLPRGPFLFACRHGAPVIPGFVLHEAPGRYRAVVEDPLWPAGRGIDAAKDLLDRMARVLEKYLVSHGDQWYCFEKVWE